MHAPYDRSRKSNQSTFSRSGIGLLAIPALVAMVLAALALLHPKASIWISEAVQAEFAGSIIADDTSAQAARPAAPIRTVTPTDVNAGYANSQR
jgi:hypothetical protein